MIYFDQDGNMSKWAWLPLEMVRKKGYFRSVTPRMNVIEAAAKLDNLECFGGTYGAVWKDETYFEEEKRDWITEHAPFIGDRQFYVPCGSDKGKMFHKAVGRKMQANDILLDDNSGVLRQWEAAGGTGVKLYTAENGSHGSWKGLFVTEEMSAHAIAMYLYKVYLQKTAALYCGIQTNTTAGAAIIRYLANCPVQENQLVNERVLKQFCMHPHRCQQGKGEDAEVIAYYFNPYGRGAWLITEADYDEGEQDFILFGYMHLYNWEWGSVRLSEILDTKINIAGFSFSLEREMYSKGKTVKELVR